MKTRKVGKIVSLLLAIVLVAAIMIPAASVLADSTKYAGVTWTEVGSYTELKAAINAANDATDDAGKTAYIKVTADITLDRPYFYKDEINGGSTDWTKMYAYSVVRLSTIATKKSSLWSSGTKDHDVVEWLNGLSGNGSAYDLTNTASPFYGMTAEELTSPFIVTEDMQEYVGMGKKSLKYSQYTGNDEKIGYEYDKRLLIIEDGSNVTLDLNGKTVKASDFDPYTGSPQWQMSCFVVETGGTLTITDLADGSGQLSGGTGNVVFDGNFHEDSNGEVKRGVILYSDYTIYDGSGLGTSVFSKGEYRVEGYSRSWWINDVKESRGGGVYVCDGATLNLEAGNITKNSAWMAAGNYVFSSGVQSTVKGGGVYVEAGGTFNMSGGEVSNNAARCYNKESDSKNSWAYGGGVYLAPSEDGKVATFNMTGGRIAENAVYAESFSSGKTKSATAQGAGIYVGAGAVCNIMGNEVEEGATTAEMLSSFPRITNNSCGGQTRKGCNDDAWVTVQGGGIYCDGTLNIQNAVVSANEFSEVSADLDEISGSPVGLPTVHVYNDKETGLPYYIYDYNSDGTAKTYITRADDRFTENLELATEEVNHETSGIFGTGRGNNNNVMSTDGAGVYVSENAKMYVGSRTWITDNYDLITACHKPFNDARHYARYWDKTADGGMGRYIYTGEKTENISSGYVFSDTRDDVYLPDGVTMYKANSLFESKIGVNYYDMVDKAGDVTTGGIGRASNRVIVKSSTGLDFDLWGNTGATPTQSDIQFFSLNDNNKNYERDNYVQVSRTKATQKTVGISVDCELLDPKLLDSTTTEGDLLIPGGWDARDDIRTSVVDVNDFTSEDGQYKKNYLSPFYGYVDFQTIYPANTWYYSTQVKYDEGANLGNTGTNRYYTFTDETYFLADFDKSPTTSAIANSNVVFPQRAYQLDTATANLSESVQRARFMDYTVVFDESGFGTASAPVLRFSSVDDREMYVTYAFDEANTTYYGENTNKQNLNETISVDTLLSTKTPFSTIDENADGSSFTFYGKNKPTGTLVLNKIVPDYKAYKASAFTDRTNNRKSELTSLTVTNGHEDSDLYFKGWSFYTSYGYGPEILTLSNSVDLQQMTVSGSGLVLDYRGTFVVDLNKIINMNVNAQPCPTMTATWYSKEELAEARKNVSNIMCQQVQRDNGDGTFTKMLRFVSIAGSNYVDFDEVGFVISTTNATPTIEGGYDFVAKSEVYEKLAFNPDTADAKKYYDVDTLLGGSYSAGASDVVDATWTFTSGSQFATNVTTGMTGKTGYKDAGLFYANIVITDANKDTVYFATPYAKIGDTYYYGESRGVAYSDYQS